MKLMMSDWKVDLVNDSVCDFTVLFKGPPDSEALSLDAAKTLAVHPAQGRHDVAATGVTQGSCWA